jgi:hypothetical protein
VVWKARRVVVVGVGVGCGGTCGGRVVEGRFRVPVVRTESRIVLVVGTGGVFCRIVATGFGASFLAGAAFFAFVAPLWTAVVFPATGFCSSTALAPASPGTVFFGRPRFLMAGGSIVVVGDIVTSQLDGRLKV